LKYLGLIISSIFFLLSAAIIPVYAATLELQPGTGTANAGDTISVDLVLNVDEDENVWGYEAYILFPTDLLTYNASQFLAGSVFAIGGKTIQSASGDKIAVGGYFDSSSVGTTTGGVVATLRFSAQAAGSAVVSIICDQFTNVYSISPDSTNLFTDCAAVAPKSTFTIAGAGAANPTSTPTPTSAASGASATATPTPASGLSELPETGNLRGEILLIFGLIFIVFGGFATLGFSQITSRSTRIKNK
jgi:hypothetical protein